MDEKTVVVDEHQGIDLDAIKAAMQPIPKDNPIYNEQVEAIKEDVLELVEHAVESGLLDRVRQARKDMAAQDAEAILPSQQ